MDDRHDSLLDIQMKIFIDTFFLIFDIGKNHPERRIRFLERLLSSNSCLLFSCNSCRAMIRRTNFSDTVCYSFQQCPFFLKERPLISLWPILSINNRYAAYRISSYSDLRRLPPFGPYEISAVKCIILKNDARTGHFRVSPGTGRKSTRCLKKSSME